MASIRTSARTDSHEQLHTHRSLPLVLRTLGVGIALALPLLLGLAPIGASASGGVLTAHSAPHTPVAHVRYDDCPGGQIPCA